ncbi:hypothetical protein BLNAU_23127 [Blattamonas nauphoetae]|uniref:Protein kinase domain-containing protein n=1 Tax=Blattamonas nauphoetae TaxID=2049346 RepID=A0ABQ9WR61_9EUKA|nr:hypothetical protein BLNAU_23127 [Blattamonas nauphoetae]
MLGCVVSLTSSHLSGSTIRDMNTGGSVLCSNSSFSSLLSSPNTDTEPFDPTYAPPEDPGGTSDPVKTPPAETPEPEHEPEPEEEPSAPHKPIECLPEDFKDGTVYDFTSVDDSQETSAKFWYCSFKGSKYQSSARPLTFNDCPGTVTVSLCSFTGFAFAGDAGAAVFVSNKNHIGNKCFTAVSSRFTSCSSTARAGALYVSVVDGVCIGGCDFTHCSTTADNSCGGALCLYGRYTSDPITERSFRLTESYFTNCTARGRGGGVHLSGVLSLSASDTWFRECEVFSESAITFGGGIFLAENVVLTMIDNYFIECSSRHAGSAIASRSQNELNLTRVLVKNCSSGTTGAICIVNTFSSSLLSFSIVLFVGNSVGEDTTFFSSKDVNLTENATKFTDLALIIIRPSLLPTLHFETCFTTVSSDSSGMIVGTNYDDWKWIAKSERYFDPEFDTISSRLTEAPTVRLNEVTGKIELELQGKTPLTSQEYEVKLKKMDGTETRLRILFVNGTGTLVSGSEYSLKFNTRYVITSIVGVVAGSANAVWIQPLTIPVEAWAFNLAATPSFLPFTTPKNPFLSTLQDATAHLIDSDPQSAFVVLHFDKEVCGSYDLIVLEGGKPVALTITVNSKFGATKEFKVIGDGKLLTHDTTYTIESIVPAPGTDSLFVLMNDLISFHIPQSSYVPPDEPEDAEAPEDKTQPETEDLNDKKAMSPEMKKLLSWLIPLVACLLVALVLAIVLVVLVNRRKQKKAQQTQKETEAQDSQTNDILHTNRRTHSAFDSSSALSTDVTLSSQGVESLSVPKGEPMEVMACNGGFEVSLVCASTTLFSMLHVEKREIPKRKVGQQVVDGLMAVLAKRQASDVMTRLSSHWILVDPLGNVQLRLQMRSTEAEQEEAHMNQLHSTSEATETLQHLPKYVEQAGMDGLRWRAPEVVACGWSAVDQHKAAVFSLGLVLWEIETGQVPFGALDAVNAQKQSATGIGPKMDTLKNEEFVALIRRCVQADPNHRPTLSEVAEFLSYHPEE